jgi:hypothetical protein
LQSLVLMNDPVFVEAARAVAQRILTSGEPDAAARLRLIWRLALSRQPDDRELAILQEVLQQQSETYANDPEAAKRLAAVGDLARPDGLSDSELATWTAVANVILNLNETISN